MNLNMLRKLARPGDILFIDGGNGLVSTLIKYGQKKFTEDGSPSQWSHMALVYDSDLLIESTLRVTRWFGITNGITITSTSYYQNCNCSLALMPLTKKQRDTVVKTALRLLEEGVSYPICGLVGSLLSYYVLGGKFGNPLQSKRSLYCSAFVQECYLSIGMDFSEYYTSRNTPPQLIFNYLKYNNVEIVQL